MSIDTLGLVAALLFGVSIGSFLNVVIWRVPQGGSISSPTWSYCPNCRTRLRTADLIPLVSFLALGRRCRTCRKPISWRYFTVEAITGAAFALVYLREGWTLDTVFHCLFVACLIATLFIDLDYFIIPDELNVFGVALGLVAAGAHGLLPASDFTSAAPHGHALNLIGSSALSAVVCALIFNLISFAGYLYYGSRPRAIDDGEPAPRVVTKPSSARRALGFWLDVLDDYAYLAAKFLCLGAVFPVVKRYVSERDELIRADAETVDAGKSPLAEMVEPAPKSRLSLATSSISPLTLWTELA